MRWLELRAQVSPELVEPLVELFARYVRTAASIEEPGGFNADDGETPPVGAPVTVRAFLPLTRRAQSQRARIETGYQLLSLIQPLPPLEVRTLHRRDWEETVNAFVRPLRVGEHLVFCPPGVEYAPQEGDVVVTLEPGLGFGTGHHPTTRMCLEEMERRLRPGMRILDLGTGSGVLALAAAHLGAAQVVAVEREPQALRAARRNVRATSLSRRVRVLRGDAPPEGDGGFDLTVANITARVLMELAPRLVASLGPGGILVASGVLAEQAAEVARRFAEADVGLVALERRESEGWVALVGARA